MQLTDFIHEIEVRTAVPGAGFTYDLLKPSDPRTQAILNAIRPVILIRGPLGNFVVDYARGTSGSVSPQFEQAGYATGIGLAAGLFGVGLLLRALLKAR